MKLYKDKDANNSLIAENPTSSRMKAMFQLKHTLKILKVLNESSVIFNGIPQIVVTNHTFYLNSKSNLSITGFNCSRMEFELINGSNCTLNNSKLSTIKAFLNMSEFTLSKVDFGQA